MSPVRLGHLRRHGALRVTLLFVCGGGGGAECLFFFRRKGASGTTDEDFVLRSLHACLSQRVTRTTAYRGGGARIFAWPLFLCCVWPILCARGGGVRRDSYGPVCRGRGGGVGARLSA